MKRETLNQDPVFIDEDLIHHIGVREWGLPTLCMPGQIWRSEENNTITCMTYRSETEVNIETRPLLLTKDRTRSVMPDSWRAALWIYVQAWPSSGHGYGPFLDLTEKVRCDFIRDVAKNLFDNDLGCLSIANMIGDLAAYNYDTEPTANAVRVYERKTAHHATDKKNSCESRQKEKPCAKCNDSGVVKVSNTFARRSKFDYCSCEAAARKMDGIFTREVNASAGIPKEFAIKKLQFLEDQLTKNIAEHKQQPLEKGATAARGVELRRHGVRLAAHLLGVEIRKNGD